MSSTRKIFLGCVAGWLSITVLGFLIFGSAGRNDEFSPDTEFAIPAWMAREEKPRSSRVMGPRVGRGRRGTAAGPRGEVIPCLPSPRGPAVAPGGAAATWLPSTTTP